MIVTLSGVVSEKLDELVVVDVQGVGYGLMVTSEDYTRLSLGETTKLYVHEHIREDAHDLYGFTAPQIKVLFELLLSVKNVGPKVALAVLGIGSEGVVRGSIASGDIKRLQTAKGVGKRAAEQIVVELRDKVGLMVSGDAEDIVSRGGVGTRDEAVQALVALGFSEVDAQTALSKVDKDLPTEERLKLALRS